MPPAQHCLCHRISKWKAKEAAHIFVRCSSPASFLPPSRKPPLWGRLHIISGQRDDLGGETASRHVLYSGNLFLSLSNSNVHPLIVFICHGKYCALAFACFYPRPAYSRRKSTEITAKSSAILLSGPRAYYSNDQDVVL